jgi:hypothetical protein
MSSLALRLHDGGGKFGPLLIPWSDISNPDLSGGKVRDVTEV